MDNGTVSGIVLVLSATAISAVSQVLLKYSAKRIYQTRWREYINPLVITAYLLYFVTTILSVIALRYIPLTLSTAIGASGQIFVPLLSFLALKEQISRRRFMGMAIIILGILLFSL